MELHEQDLSLQLPRDMFHHIVHSLREALPLLPNATQEDRRRRDHYIISEIAALLPANGDEANLAALYVALSAEALECQRASRGQPADSKAGSELGARADRMFREARAMRSLLLRVQAARRKREAEPGECSRAAWHEHCLIGMMADAFGLTPPAPMAPPVPEPPAEPTPPFEQLSEAEQYAVMYPRRAALIRRLGGLPQPCDFGPPEPALVRAIIATDTPVMRAVDVEERSSA